MKLNPTLFREYDIRGQVDQSDGLTPQAIEAIGKAFAVFLKRRGITQAMVGHDARAHSKKVKDITVQALLVSGISVKEIGQVLTPIFYFAQHYFKEKGGVMITASHNVGQWSGFKHAYDYSKTLLPDEVREIRTIAEQKNFSQGQGKHEIYSTKDLIETYTKDILKNIKLSRPLRVVVDTANGTAGLMVPEILRRAGCEIYEQYSEVSEERHHEANPSNLGMIAAMSEGVKRHHADLGLGFDEDGDRLGAVDDQGKAVWPDRILIFLARPILTAKPGAKIVFDVKCSEALIKDIAAHGGMPVMWKTGHSYIKAKTKEVGAILAGERSGHIFFAQEHYGFDDASYAALKFLEFLSREKKTLSQLAGELPQYFTSPVWHAPCGDTEKYEVVRKLTERFKEEYGTEKVIDINGARVYLEDGWGLVRASSNLPALVFVFEAKTEMGLKKIETVFRKKLTKFPEVGKEWISG